MTMTMPAKEAAKLLRRHNEWRRGEDGYEEPTYSPAELGQAIDAAVAALESQHPRERALSEDAARGNFRAPK